MNAHKNARTTPFGRAVMIRRVIQEGWSVSAVAASFEVSTRTVRKWLAGMPRAAHRCQTPGRRRAAAVLNLDTDIDRQHRDGDRAPRAGRDAHRCTIAQAEPAQDSHSYRRLFRA